MAEPKRGMKPMVIDETPGKKAYCQCGLSAKLPYCDGSHSRENTGLSPCVIDVSEGGKKAVCQCFHTADTPWCDGSHSRQGA